MPPARILIVEDQGLQAMGLRLRLERLGHLVTGVATTGDAALANVQGARPDLALVDIRLPGPMNGIELARRLLADYNLPVVYSTAQSDEATFKAAQSARPYGFLIKPYDETALSNAIIMALKMHEQQQGLPAPDPEGPRYAATLAAAGDLTEELDRVVGALRAVPRPGPATVELAAIHALVRKLQQVLTAG